MRPAPLPRWPVAGWIPSGCHGPGGSFRLVGGGPLRPGDQPPAPQRGGLTSEICSLNGSVPIANLLAATKTLALAILDWCGVA